MMIKVFSYVAMSSVAIGGILFVAAVLFPTQVWPAPEFPSGTATAMERQLREWQEHPFTYTHRFQKYEPLNDYLNYGQQSLCTQIEGRRQIAQDGTILLWNSHDEEYQKSSVAIAQCGLKAYGHLISGRGDGDAMMAQVNALLSIQEPSGAFRREGTDTFYLTGPGPARSGAMGQGQGLSLLARAYSLSGESSLLDAGQRALDYMITPVAEGGTMTTLAGIHPSLDQYIFFEEVPADPPTYILNGYIFALLGLYDWSHLEAAGGYGADKATRYFKEGVETLKRILPYYDAGALSSYDLGHITYGTAAARINIRYHAVHVWLLAAMYSITGEPVFDEYRQKWERTLLGSTD